MADTKTLEMRVAELEDKLSKVHITEDEMKTYHKVAAALAPAAATAALSPQLCVVSQCVINHPCISPQCIIQCIQCIRQCIRECTCGPCIQSGGGGLGGGFGTLGG
jgi:hypothetical protein